MHAEFITYPQSKHIYKPSSTEELEITLRRAHHNLQTVLRRIKPQTKMVHHRPQRQRHDQETQRKRFYLLTHSDKGSEYCVIKREAYKKAAMNHLKDPNTYRKIPRMSA